MLDPREILRQAERRRFRREATFWAVVSVLLCSGLGGILWLMI